VLSRKGRLVIEVYFEALITHSIASVLTNRCGRLNYVDINLAALTKSFTSGAVKPIAQSCDRPVRERCINWNDFV
jgi:hypothetical protein